MASESRNELPPTKNLDPEERVRKFSRRLLWVIAALVAVIALAVPAVAAVRDGTSEAWQAFAASVVLVGMLAAVTFAMKWY
ncbi:hypothetical protein [Mycolicibacterium sp.]|uniref:hypothetical protein n=1 Tax=Mycolicibacterium sp. TaxID=2320850 RepID=UPI0037CB8A28